MKKLSVNKFNLIFILLIFLSACKSKEKIERKAAIPNISTKQIIEKANANLFDFQWISGKISAEVNAENKKTSFNTNFRIRKDSVIWMSISPALGIEVARVIISQDTVKFINRMNNTFFEGDYKYINKMFNVDADYDMIQALLLGNPNFDVSNEDDENFKSKIDENSYLISTMKKRKLDKVIMGKNEPSELVAHSFWFNHESFKLEKFQFNDFSLNRLLVVDYKDFKEVDDTIFPNFITITLSGSNEGAIKVNYNKIKKEDSQSVPFNIPSKYQRIE